MKTAVMSLTLALFTASAKAELLAEFQRDWVERSIDGRQKIASHGAYTMPVWGEDFSQIGDPDAERATRTMIARLVDYLETLQQK